MIKMALAQNQGRSAYRGSLSGRTRYFKGMDTTKDTMIDFKLIIIFFF
jgi:hypothetical protein